MPDASENVNLGMAINKWFFLQSSIQLYICIYTYKCIYIYIYIYIHIHITCIGIFNLIKFATSTFMP